MQKIIAGVFERLMKSRSWMVLIILTILIKWASWYSGWVERNYTYGIYPAISNLQRILLGWLPFSVGDLFYGFLILIIIYKTFGVFKALFAGKLNRQYLAHGLEQLIFFLLLVYVFFNLLWGLNYNRRGIARQLNLEIKPVTLAELDTLTSILQSRANDYAAFLSEAQRDFFDRNMNLFKASAEAFQLASGKYPFLKYKFRSIKPSLFSYLGNYLGFQGYYNPFSGEAQVNTTVPRVLEPFVTMHEIAHQLGYAKENEANFVAYLAISDYYNHTFRYSVYFNMYNYALGELWLKDSLLAKSYQEKSHPQLKKDQQEVRDFFLRYKNPLENIIMWVYSQFLKANNQPAGKRSYDEVVMWLVAYYKKYGKDAL